MSGLRIMCPASKAVAELANHLGNHFCHEGIVLDDED
jgi:hypothetical protein